MDLNSICRMAKSNDITPVYSNARILEIGWFPNDNGTWKPVDYGPSDTDLWLFNVPGINRQFIANEQGQIYEFLEDGTMIIIQP